MEIDLNSLEGLERFLTANKLAGPHNEYSENGEEQHVGYEAFCCRVCGTPTIRARGMYGIPPQTCGRIACDKEATEPA